MTIEAFEEIMEKHSEALSERCALMSPDDGGEALILGLTVEKQARAICDTFKDETDVAYFMLINTIILQEKRKAYVASIRIT